MSNPPYIIGIDEAGRGPLAGPVYVGAVAVEAGYDFQPFTGLTDSKQLSENQREKLWQILHERGEEESISYSVHSSDNGVVDIEGINPAISAAVGRCLAELEEQLGVPAAQIEVRLDGGLKAPRAFENQTTIIKGDVSEPAISLASVVAKVSRDRYMKALAADYPNFDFASHKGYGTKAHREALKTYGPTDIHRRTYIQRIVKTDIDSQN